MIEAQETYVILHGKSETQLRANLRGAGWEVPNDWPPDPDMTHQPQPEEVLYNRNDPSEWVVLYTEDDEVLFYGEVENESALHDELGDYELRHDGEGAA